MRKKLVALMLVGAMAFSMAACGGSDEAEPAAEETQAQETTENSQSPGETVESEEPAEPATEHFEVDLSAGNYVSGVDIPAGTYNLTATGGSGNVSSTNMYSGGLNEMMGSPADELYHDTFNNLQLPEGETLTLGGTVRLHIVSEDAQTGNMKSRSINGEVQTDLSSGNYTAGTDFPAGVYNIVSTGASGNVSSDNMFDGGLNEVLGDGSDGFSVSQVNNVELPEGTILTLSGADIQLVPVGSAE